ncbi:hypothetical protein [Patulibacter americanus]|uniref:hypothetical protein n=1 Tax=Patulibacter americanus TaxID=588672 RepID=UPI0003B68E27|nr:hypothetical protein [Patulibacter americanus]
MAWIPRPSRADPDEARELARWHRERAARDALDEVDPALWDPERPERTPAEAKRRPIARGDHWHPDGWPSREPGEAPPDPADDEDDDGPDPALHTKPRIAVYAATAAVWLGLVTVLHLQWWTFERSLFVSIFAPFLLGRVVERVILKARPDLNRHRAVEEAVQRRSRQKAAELGERAQPYWAREGADAIEAPSTPREPDPAVERPPSVEGTPGEARAPRIDERP